MKEPESCLHVFFADVLTHGEWPLLSEKSGHVFRHITKREAANKIFQIASALGALQIDTQSRITFQGPMNAELWLMEWGALANRNVIAILPIDFSLNEFLEILAENKSKIVFVSTMLAAQAIAAALTSLPDLKYIICLEGGMKNNPSILSWAEFLASGEAKDVNNVSNALQSILSKDMAILFYSRDENRVRRAISYTHGALLEKARQIDAVLAHQTAAEKTAITVRYKHAGNWRKTTSYSQKVESDPHYIRTIDTVMAAANYAHAIGHITSYYVPVLKEAAVQIAGTGASQALSLYRPHIIIGEAGFFDAVQHYVTLQMQQAGKLQRVMFRDVLQLGKLSYEASTLNVIKRMQYAFLKKLLDKKIQRMLGERLRLLIGADDDVHYETKVFFHTFGIVLIELPLAMLDNTP